MVTQLRQTCAKCIFLLPMIALLITHTRAADTSQELFNTIISLFFNTQWRISRLTIIIILWLFYSLYPWGQAYITALPLFICSSETCMFLKYMTRRYKIKHVFVLYKFSAQAVKNAVTSAQAIVVSHIHNNIYFVLFRLYQ